MDPRIRHEHIASEARRINHITRRNDDTANWYEAIETLKIFPSLTYDVSNVYNAYNLSDSEGYFGLIRPGFSVRHSISWFSCREIFERDIFAHHPRYHGNFKFGFFFNPSAFEQEYRVAHFIRNIELERLNLGELTTFMRVRNKPFIYCRPSSFWNFCQMRFSLFTVLLRAGRYYHFNTIEDALMSHPYSRSTMGAIRAFMNGRRNYTGRIYNWRAKWVAQYENLHESQVTTLAY